jgi:ABC-type dipeptide/oligopeptide/nickel transport system permease component
MAKQLFLRLLGAIPAVFLVLTLAFAAMRILPGDPTLAVLGPTPTAGSWRRFVKRWV